MNPINTPNQMGTQQAQMEIARLQNEIAKLQSAQQQMQMMAPQVPIQNGPALNYIPSPSLQTISSQYPQQQAAPPKKTPPIYGRLVNDIREVSADDIPMDGAIRLFMLGSLEAIYAKQWTGEGKLENVKYVPERPNPYPATSDYQDIVNRLDMLTEEVRKLSERYSGNFYKNKNGPKKESNGGDLDAGSKDLRT